MNEFQENCKKSQFLAIWLKWPLLGKMAKFGFFSLYQQVFIHNSDKSEENNFLVFWENNSSEQKSMQFISMHYYK